MHKFDVKYSFDNYYEYYKFVLIRQRIVRDIVFCVLFIAVAVYWWVDTSEATNNNLLPIFSVIMGVVFPLMNVVTLPMLKKQLHSRQEEIDRTHIVVTFDEDEIIYENLTIVPVAEDVKDENNNNIDDVKEENNNVNEVKDENVNTDDGNVVNENTSDDDSSKDEEENVNNEKIFKLKYNNFLEVKETKGLFLFYLDKQTVIILPKERYQNGSDFTAFKDFISNKVNVKRIKFLKEKTK